MRSKLKLFAGFFAVILQIIFLAIPLVGIASAGSQGDFTVYSSGLGNVYGIAFDATGNLYATGTVQEKVVLWKIGKDGQKSVFSELRDDVDAMGMIGIATHTKHLTNLSVDGQGNIWIASSQHGACFIVTSAGEMFKVYLNKEYSMSVDEKSVPSGITWDNKTGKLYLITSGPDGKYSTNNVHHIAAFDDCENGYGETLFAGDNKSLRFVENTGTAINETAVDLLKEDDSPLYLLGLTALYEVQFGGNLKMIGKPFNGLTPFSGTVVDGTIYFSAKDKSGKGYIYKMDSKGNMSVFSEGGDQPGGLAYQEGFLYVADKAGERILKKRIKTIE